jgi:hypothetical protein
MYQHPIPTASLSLQHQLRDEEPKTRFKNATAAIDVFRSKRVEGDCDCDLKNKKFIKKKSTQQKWIKASLTFSLELLAYIHIEHQYIQVDKCDSPDDDETSIRMRQEATSSYKR